MILSNLTVQDIQVGDVLRVYRYPSQKAKNRVQAVWVCTVASDHVVKFYNRPSQSTMVYSDFEGSPRFTVWRKPV